MNGLFSNFLKNTFQSAQTWFSRLTYPRKFLVVTLIFAMPLAAFFPLMSQQAAEIDRYGYKAYQGTQYIRITQNLLDAVLEHQRIANQYFAKQTDAAALEQAGKNVESVFEEYTALANQRNERDIEGLLAAELQIVKDEWAALTKNILQMNQAQSSLGYDSIVAKIFQLIEKTSQISYLVVDSDLNTKYLSDTILVTFPQQSALLQNIFLLTQKGIDAGAFSQNEKVQMIILLSQLEESLKTLNRNIAATLSNNNSNDMQALAAAHQAYQTQLGIWIESIREQTLESETIDFSTQELEVLFQAPQKAQREMYQIASQALESSIQNRINSLSAEFYFAFGVAFLSVGIAFMIGTGVMNSISRPLTQLTDAAYRLSKGELGVRVPIYSQDEVGIMANTFNQMAQELEANQVTLKARAKALTASAEVNRHLSTILDFSELIKAIVEQIQTVFNYYHVHIYLVDEKTEELVMAGGTGEAGQILLARGHKIQKGKGLVGRAAETNKVVLAADTSSTADWLPNPLLPETKSEIAAPISVGEQVLGVLDVQHNIVHGLTQEDADLIEAISNQVAVALRNARAYSEIQARAEREALLASISQKIQSANTIERALQVTLSELSQAVGAQDAHIALRASQLREKRI